MGLLDVTNNYEPKENPEFSNNKKKLVGDGVAQLTLEAIISKKNGKSWYVLKGEVINAIADEKGRETTLEAGDSIDKIYDPDNNESLQDLMDDLFTTGIQFGRGTTEDEQFQLMKSATDGQLAYYRTWAKDKPKDKIEEGKPTYWQNIKILSKNKITDQNSVPTIAF